MLSADGAAAVLIVLANRVRPRLGRIRSALLVGLAVFSHWWLDALVHIPELPLGGDTSNKVGLSLWNYLPVALMIESLIALAGYISILPVAP